MSNLLIPGPFFQAPDALAVKIGINEAIVFQKIHLWTHYKRSNRQKYAESFQRDSDGILRCWIYNSAPKWQKHFPYWSEKTIKRILQNLRDLNLLIVEQLSPNPMNRENWYAVNYDELDKMSEGGEFDPLGNPDDSEMPEPAEPDNAIDEYESEMRKMGFGNASGQNGPMERNDPKLSPRIGSKSPRPSGQNDPMYYTNIQTHITSKESAQSVADAPAPHAPAQPIRSTQGTEEGMDLFGSEPSRLPVQPDCDRRVQKPATPNHPRKPGGRVSVAETAANGHSSTATDKGRAAQSAIAIWCAAYKSRRGENPKPVASDRATLAWLYNELGEEKYMLLCKTYLHTDDTWISDRDFPISVLRKQYPAWLERASNPRRANPIPTGMSAYEMAPKGLAPEFIAFLDARPGCGGAQADA